MDSIDNYIEELIEKTEIPKELKHSFHDGNITKTESFILLNLFGSVKMGLKYKEALYKKYSSIIKYENLRIAKGIAKRNILKILKKYPYN